MAELTVPRRIFAQMFLPKGHRTLKKPVYIAPYVPSLALDSTPFRKNYDRWHHSRYGEKAYTPFVEQGLFEHWEYRFWCAQAFGKDVASECRCCGAEGPNTTTLRGNHFKGGCTTKLVKAYALLLRDKLCAICDLKTEKQMWGVPLCSSACVQAWCEAESQPKSLTCALLIIQRENT